MGKEARSLKNLLLWEDNFSKRSWGRYPSDELVRFVARTFGDAPVRSAVRFLEVGCGPGPNIWYLVREGYAVSGIDGSATAIKQAIERLRLEGLPGPGAQVDLRQGDFSVLPWPGSYFDAVIDLEAIYANELKVIHSCVREIHRVLKRGGVFFGKMFGVRTSGYKTGTEIETNTFDNPAEGPCAGFGISHFFTEAELRELFSSFSTLSLDWVDRSDRGGTVRVFEWLVTAKK